MKKIIIGLILTTLLFAQQGNDRSAEFFSNWFDAILMFRDTTIVGVDTTQRVQDGFGYYLPIKMSQTEFEVVSDFLAGDSTLYVDSTLKRIGINTLSPDSTVHIVGSMHITGNVLIDGTIEASNVERIIELYIVAGGTPGTNISVFHQTNDGVSYNYPAISDANNITDGGAADGSFALATVTLIMDITETVISGGIPTVLIQDTHNSDATKIYGIRTYVSGGNLIFQPYLVGGGITPVNWLNVLTSAGDGFYMRLLFHTST